MALRGYTIWLEPEDWMSNPRVPPEVVEVVLEKDVRVQVFEAALDAVIEKLNEILDTLDQAREVLETLEYIPWNESDAYSRCPICCVVENLDHAPDCELAKVLEDLDEGNQSVQGVRRKAGVRQKPD